MTDRETLIEGAAKAAHESVRQERGRRWESLPAYIKDVERTRIRAALSVFEKALGEATVTPTDDEREALIREARRPQGAFSQANLVGPLADALETTLRRPDVLSAEDFRKQIADERARQIDDGYDTLHDRAHGVDHLLTWAQDYARRGRSVQAAALVEAARELIAKSPEPQGEPSDAQVQAAWEELNEIHDTGSEAMRAALRAAWDAK